MAPKNKFTREEMVTAALNVVRKKGSGALTARAVAEELGVSTQPIFTCFGTMEELREEVFEAAEEKYHSYVLEGLKARVPFFGFGMRYISFAREEKELYKLLFLSEGKSAASALEITRPTVIGSLMSIYKLDNAEAERFYRDMMLVGSSIASMIVTGSCPYNEKEIATIITGFSISICKAIKEVPGFVDDSYDRDKVFMEIIK